MNPCTNFDEKANFEITLRDQERPCELDESFDFRVGRLIQVHPDLVYCDLLSGFEESRWHVSMQGNVAVKANEMPNTFVTSQDWADWRSPGFKQLISKILSISVIMIKWSVANITAMYLGDCPIVLNYFGRLIERAGVGKVSCHSPKLGVRIVRKNAALESSISIWAIWI